MELQCGMAMAEKKEDGRNMSKTEQFYTKADHNKSMRYKRSHENSRE